MYIFSMMVMNKMLKAGQISFEMTSDLISSTFVHSKNLFKNVMECGKDVCAKISAFFAK